MITPKFILRSNSNSPDVEGTVSVLFYINREKVQWSIKIPCINKNWDDVKGLVKKSDPDYENKNLIIHNIIGRINRVDVDYILRKKQLTKALFLKSYNRPDDFETFILYCKHIMKKNRKKMEISTYKMHSSCIKKLEEYNSALIFDDITSDMLDDYSHYLRRTLKNNDNTTHKNMSVIRKYVFQAMRDGYIETNPFENFRVAQSKPNIVFLEEDELQLLYDLYRTTDYPEKYKSTLQVFLFLCFGSQHIGDARKMRIEDFNNVTFTYYRQKLQHSKPEKIFVPISMPVRIIINDLITDRSEGLLFLYMLPDQKMNYYLKEIADFVGIKKRISLKTGRHTFATIFLENNPNPKVLQEILGHSDIKQTMNYVHALEKTKQRGISCFDKFTE